MCGVVCQVAADPELKYVAQRAFTSYVRSVSLQPNKDVFDASALPLDAFSEVRLFVFTSGASLPITGKSSLARFPPPSAAACVHPTLCTRTV